MLVKLGDWYTFIHAGTNDIHLVVSQLYEILWKFATFESNIYYDFKEITHLVIASSSKLSNSDYPKWLSEKQIIYWSDFIHAYQDNGLSQSGFHSPNFSSYMWPSLYYGQFTHNTNIKKIFEKELFGFVINGPTENSFIQVFLFLIFLVTIWHIDHGGLCLHSSAVVRGDEGFLFLGQSEAGKSTIAKMSSEIGYKALGDDMNLILCNHKKSYSIAAIPSLNLSPAGYSLQQPHLRGIFKLIQDDRDFLIPLSHMQTAKHMLDGVFQLPGSVAFPNQAFKYSFHTISKIVRSVPGYELHFRKSPDFWKVIDVEFGLD